MQAISHVILRESAGRVPASSSTNRWPSRKSARKTQKTGN